MRMGLAVVWALLVSLCGCGIPYEAATAPAAGRPRPGPAPIHAKVERLTSPDVDPARAERLVIYNGSIHLVVERVDDALAQIKQAVEALGGWMQDLNSRSITVKVPAGKFHQAIDAVEKLGEVARKEVKGSDVTDQVRDLRIRLQNAEALRQRLLKLVDKSAKVEDTLKIEKELARVTEQVEMLKGKLQYIEKQVAYSTLTVRVNAAVPQREVETEIPFAWVRSLGQDITRGTTGHPRDTRGLFGGIGLDLPEGYIRHSVANDETWAMSADGVILHVRRHDNYKGGGVDFWCALVRRALVKRRAFATEQPADLAVRGGVPGRMLVGSKEIARKPHGYLVVVVARKRHVYTFEAWGPKDAFDRDRERLEAAARSEYGP